MSSLPLSGFRVLDFTWVIAGPYCCQLLATMGAEVIKIESQRHIDLYRRLNTWAEGVPGPNRSGRYNSLNYSKRACTLNVSHPKGLTLAKELVKKSDVVVESMSYGVMDRMGLGYQALRELKPDIIMLSLSLMGQTGPDKELMGFGPVMLAATGLSRLTSYPGGRPYKVGGTWPDYTSSIGAAFAILAALHHRCQTGQGQYIDFALNDLTLSLLPEVITDYTMNGRIRQPEGNRDEIMAPHNVYRCLGEDKWVAIAVEGEGQWRAFCQVLGHPEWQEDQRFNDPFRRWQNQGELDPLIEAWTRERTPYQVTEALQGVGVAAAPSFDIADLVNDPHLQERGVFQEIDHPEVGKRQYIGIPWKLDGVDPRFDPAPLLGEGNQYVFGDLLGLSPEEVRRLEEEKAIY